MANEVLIEQRDHVLVITLNRPDARNAINRALADALLAAVGELDADPALRVGVLTGAGRGFSAGMDLKGFAAGEDLSSVVRFLHEGAEKPLIAAVEGFCVGGGLEMALACDLIVCADDARFGVPEVRVGIFAAGGGLLRLPRRVPFSVAMEMALTADPIPASRALELGLVARVAPAGGALDAALALAERVTRNAPLAVAATKKLLRAVHGRTEEELWELQASEHTRVFRSDDAREGALAFAEKRPPLWTGR